MNRAPRLNKFEAMYEKEINDLIYAYGGNKTTDVRIIERLEADIRNFLMTLLQKIHTNVSKISCNAILEALEGTVEHYGAKRCWMLEMAKKKYSKALKAEAEDIDVMDEDITDDASDSSENESEEFQFDTFNLDDGTEVYRQYYQNLVYDLQQADKLTLNMDSEEYLEYSSCAKTTFVFAKPTKFAEWLSIKYKANRDALTILGWIASYRLRRSVQVALDNRQTTEDLRSLFGKPRHLLREHELYLEDYYPITYTSDVQMLLKMDDRLQPVRRRSTGILAHFIDRRQNASSESIDIPCHSITVCTLLCES